MPENHHMPILWELRGTFQGKPYAQASFDVRYLQSLLTKLMRHDGTGHIYKID